MNNPAILLFPNPRAWTAWLKVSHAKSDGIWMRLAKKGRALKSIDYAQALDGALCYGWIDSQKKSYDANSWLQRFSPRRSKSIWSKINTAKAEALIKSGKMRPAGLKQVQAAKKDGRWEKAYAGQKTMQVPKDLLAALAKNPKARAYFATLNSVNRYAILFRTHHAKKAETRARRIVEFVKMLEANKKIYG